MAVSELLQEVPVQLAAEVEREERPLLVHMVRQIQAAEAAERLK